MSSRLLSKQLCLALVVAGSLSTGTASAQEMRIYTRLFDETAAEHASTGSRKPAPVVARTLSLFHAAKVYDYIDTLGEVIIYEPGRRQFTILNTKRSLVTSIHFDELTHLTKLGLDETEKYLQELEQSNNADSVEAASALRFQLNPRFRTQFDQTSMRLKMTGEFIEYEVRGVTVESERTLEAYLNYADWTKRLNYVLHPNAMFPAPRLALNQAMREYRVFPVQVDLVSNIEARSHLRAEHEIQWKLTPSDRTWIAQWETLLNSENTKKVSFRQYQQAVLVSQNR